MFQVSRRVLMFVVLVALTAVATNAAELKLDRFYTDNMVVQRDKPIMVRGSAKPGEKVTITFAGRPAWVNADDAGRWAIKLEPLPANAEGQTLTVKSGGASVSIDNVLVGDVFLFARQSTIDLSLGKTTGMASGKNPPRVIVIDTIPAATPQADLAAKATTGWHALNAKSAAAMSEAAVLFSLDLASVSKVPVGVIEVDMGAAFPMGWLSRESIADSEKLTGTGRSESMAKRMEKLTALQAEGKPLPGKEPVDGDPLAYPFYPAAGYNAVLNPLKGIALSGIVLQFGNNYPFVVYTQLQEEGTHLDHAKLNRAYVQAYDLRKNGMRMDPEVAPRVPAELRKVFDDPNLPIGWVLVPRPGVNTLADRNVEFRELQRQTAERTDGLDLIVPDMKTIKFSHQVADDATLAKRAAAWAKHAVMDKNPAVATGPVFERIETEGDTATVYFKPGTAKGLKALNPVALEAFEVAGVAGSYVPAKATIVGDTIQLESDDINRVRRVRYDWKRDPVLGLVNAAGLPAAPFRANDDSVYQWFHTHDEEALPEEYSLPANEWSSGDLTLINGQVKTFGYSNFAGWLGPVGIRVGPFGPNMGVRSVLIGSPAEGKLKVGDVIYSANGKMLGDEHPEHVMADAITESETRDRKGKLVLGVRRGDKNMDVELKLKVMGSYSPTYPYDCAKTEKIVAQLEEWTADRGGTGDNNFLSTDVLFLLASDNPEYQGLVRRFVYNKLLKFKSGTNNWYLGYDAMLLAEYYLATGDRNVLPTLQRLTENLVANQIEEEDAGPLAKRLGGWYGRNKAFRNYPTMPSAGLVCAIGLTLGKETGTPVDEAAYAKAIKHFETKGAPVGKVIYGDAWRDEMSNFDPKYMLSGNISSDNGKISIAAVLFDLYGDPNTAHYCSLISMFAYNHTFYGHGGNFWNNFWTPLGAYVHGKPAFQHFMQGHQWYRELNRMFDGSLITNEVERVGAGHGIALTIPKNRLRITGAPKSPFAQDAPKILAPALKAYADRDYAKSEQLAEELAKTGTVPKDQLPTVEKLAHEARQIQASIDADVKRVNALIKEGRFAEAKLDIPQLQGVMRSGDPRLAAIEKALAEGKPRADDAALFAQEREAFKPITEMKVLPPASEQLVWTTVVTEAAKADAKKRIPGQVDADKASKWRMMIVENRNQMPKDWTQPDFDDKSWETTTLPMSWHLNHTALLRTTFTIDDLDSIEGLRFRAWLFRQQDIAMYINGKLVGRINNLEKKTSNVDDTFKPWAVEQLKQGENTLAVVTRQNWRWGMLFMRVYNDGFAFMLDVGRKPTPAHVKAE